MVNKLSPLLFERKCDVDPGTGCWLWRGSVQTSGYGQVRIGGRYWTTHRASWVVHCGPIPVGLWVLHRCDTPRCCNPAHLFLGTALDNSRDCTAKGRRARYHRSAPRVYKLTDEQVRRIRSGGEVAKELAAELGIARSTIYNIRNGVRKALVV